jgi:hypothetical protein
MIDSHGQPRGALEEKAETPEKLAAAEGHGKPRFSLTR